MNMNSVSNQLKLYYYGAMHSALAMPVVLLAEKEGAGGSDASGRGIGKLASGIEAQVQAVGQLIFAIAQVAGGLMMLAGLFKLKQHKDNPTQVPIGTPLTMLIIGAALAFLPQVVKTGGETVFEKDAEGYAFGASSSGSKKDGG